MLRDEGIEPGPLAVERTIQQLAKVLGVDEAEKIVDECMREKALRALHDASDLLEFAHALMARGGIVETVGRSLKVVAILRGARETGIQDS